MKFPTMDRPSTLRRHNARLNGERVYLRTLTPADASKEYAGWLNDPTVNQYLETRSVTIPELRRYIEEKDESDHAIFFGIFWKDPTSQHDGDLPAENRKERIDDPASPRGKHIGNVKLEPVDFVLSAATMGILIGDKDYWGKGVGTEVTNLITDYALSTLGLAEVNLGVMSTNVAAIRVYEKCGYNVDRIEEKSIHHDGILYDRVWMKKTVPSSVYS